MDEKERIEKVMETEGFSSSQFATEIGIQGSTLSHILNGRNKPSLDVLKKILNRFRTISSDWLILGVGSMYRNSSNSQQATLFDIKPEISNVSDIYVPKREENSVPVSHQNRQKEENQVKSSIIHPIAPEKSISKVMVFYTDGTFEELLANNNQA